MAAATFSTAAVATAGGNDCRAAFRLYVVVGVCGCAAAICRGARLNIYKTIIIRPSSQHGGCGKRHRRGIQLPLPTAACGLASRDGHMAGAGWVEDRKT